MKVELRLDWKAIEMKGDQVSRESAQRAGRIAAERARQNVIRAGRVDTGAMRDSMAVREDRSSDMQNRRYWIGSDLHYTGFQEHGTRGATARPGGVLVFTPKGSSTKVFAKSVRGVTPAYFLRDAMRSMSAKDFSA